MTIREITQIKQDAASPLLEHPTYCTLTVVVIYMLQIALVASILFQALRLIFICTGVHFNTTILLDNYWLYYSYQVVFLFTAFSMEFVYIS